MFRSGTFPLFLCTNGTNPLPRQTTLTTYPEGGLAGERAGAAHTKKRGSGGHAIWRRIRSKKTHP
jgi:hypothetical protein